MQRDKLFEFLIAGLGSGVSSMASVFRGRTFQEKPRRQTLSKDGSEEKNWIPKVVRTFV